jgi:hypothetical protein
MWDSNLEAVSTGKVEFGAVSHKGIWIELEIRVLAFTLPLGTHKLMGL